MTVNFLQRLSLSRTKSDELVITRISLLPVGRMLAAYHAGVVVS